MNQLIWLVSIALPFAPAIVLAVVLSGTFAGMGVPAPLNSAVAIFVSLMFEMTGAVAGKSYQSRVKRDGAWNSGLLFVLVYVVAVIAVVINADGEITSKLLVGMLIAFPIVSIGTYVNLAAIEQSKAADEVDTRKTDIELEFTRKEKEAELARTQAAFEFAQSQKAKDAEIGRTIKLHKTAQPLPKIVQGMDAQQPPINQAIIDELKAGTLNQSALARQYGVHRNTVGNYLDALIAQGVVQRTADGWAVIGQPEPHTNGNGLNGGGTK